MLTMVIMLVARNRRAQQVPHRKALGNETHRDCATMEVGLFEMSIPLHARSFSLPIFLYSNVCACTCLSVATSSASCVGSEPATAWQVDGTSNHCTCGWRQNTHQDALMMRREDITEHHMTTHQCKTPVSLHCAPSHNTAKNNDEEKQVATACLLVSVSAAGLPVCYLWKQSPAGWELWEWSFYRPSSNQHRIPKTMRFAHPPNFRASFGKYEQRGEGVKGTPLCPLHDQAACGCFLAII